MPCLPSLTALPTCPVVASIEETAERYHIPKPFIGLILLPIVVRKRLGSRIYPALRIIALANAAEHVTSVWMAMKNKMELTIGICVGSSIVRASSSVLREYALTDMH